MPNTAICREDVHRHSEACSDAGEAYQPIALRLLAGQRRLTRFIEKNLEELGQNESQAAIHMTSVCLRVFEQTGGRMRKVDTRDLEQAAARISGAAELLLPFDGELPVRLRNIEWRAQPHLLDEILWALYEREDKVEGELDILPDRAGLLFLTMWVLVEAIDANWTPPLGFQEASA